MFPQSTELEGLCTWLDGEWEWPQPICEILAWLRVCPESPALTQEKGFLPLPIGRSFSFQKILSLLHSQGFPFLTTHSLPVPFGSRTGVLWEWEHCRRGSGVPPNHSLTPLLMPKTDWVCYERDVRCGKAICNPQDPACHQQRFPSEKKKAERHTAHCLETPSTKPALSDPIHQAISNATAEEAFPYLSGQLPSYTSLE